MPIAVAATDKAGAVFELLIKHNILSAPVFDEKAKEHTCVVDLMDIVAASLLLDEQKELGKALAEALLDSLRDKTKEVRNSAREAALGIRATNSSLLTRIRCRTSVSCSLSRQCSRMLRFATSQVR